MEFISILGIIGCVFLLVFGILISLGIIKKPGEKYSKEENFPYRAKYNFMTPAEISFYKQLEITVGDKYYIVPQVQLSKILWAPKEYKYQNKIDKKSVDFVLFSKPDFKFVKAIELNDYTHDRTDRKERDLFVNKAIQAAGLELQTVDDRNSFKPL